MEAVGLCREGEGGKLVESGKWVRNSAGGEVFQVGGKWVVNPSGGLESKGHPIGATGLGQCAELCWQVCLHPIAIVAPFLISFTSFVAKRANGKWRERGSLFSTTSDSVALPSSRSTARILLPRRLACKVTEFNQAR